MIAVSSSPLSVADDAEGAEQLGRSVLRIGDEGGEGLPSSRAFMAAANDRMAGRRRRRPCRSSGPRPCGRAWPGSGHRHRPPEGVALALIGRLETLFRLGRRLPTTSVDQGGVFTELVEGAPSFLSLSTVASACLPSLSRHRSRRSEAWPSGRPGGRACPSRGG